MADAPDPVAQAIADLATINAKLSSGLTTIRENGREMRIDLAALRIRKNELESYLAGALMTAPRTRRVLTYTPTKGY